MTPYTIGMPDQNTVRVVVGDSGNSVIADFSWNSMRMALLRPESVMEFELVSDSGDLHLVWVTQAAALSGMCLNLRLH